MKLLLQLFSDLSQIQIVNVAKGLLCSILNIIIYLLVAIFIMGFSQGNVIPLDLYIDNNPVDLVFNILIFHFLIYFLGLIMSLYPTYIYAFLFGSNKNKNYTSDWFGLIYYKVPGVKQCKTASDYSINRHVESEFYALRFIEGAVRKFLGIMLFTVWSWLIVYVYCRHQLKWNLKATIVIVNAVFTVLVLFTYWYFTIKVKRDIGKGIKVEKYVNLAKKYYKYYRLFFFVVMCVLCFMTVLLGWHYLTVIAQLGICLLLAMHLLIYRTFRKFLDPICNIINYLSLHRKLGFVVLIILLAVNVSTELAERANPINIILCNLIAFYTAIIMGFKVYLFLKYKNEKKEENYIPIGGIKFKLMGFVWLVIGGFIFFGVNIGNNDFLHRLKIVDTPINKKIQIDDFYSKYKSVKDESRAPILYAAYGGGLKAQFWNFLILDRLHKRDGFQNIIAMSGVSGGGMGIGNFAATQYLDCSEDKRKEIIEEIKVSNLLSVELSWLFGCDFIRACLPECLTFGNDRSYRSMAFYGDKLDASHLVNKTTFYEVYNELYQKDFYPNLIINSTSTVDKYGVVSAIVNDSLFPGAINLLDINKNGTSKTLTFFEALSTCNRFPIISPSANVPNKGHFVDGGYFENSGIMSLVSFKNALSELEKKLFIKDSIFQSIFKEKVKLISVRNGKLNYLQSLLANHNQDANRIQNNNLISNKETDEVATILTGIANLDRMPNYIKSILSEYHKDEYDFIDIDLPYYIRPDEIEDLFGGELEPAALKMIEGYVDESNTEIINILKKPKWKEYELDNWGVVNPPTARILSKPVEIYMEAMMEHQNVMTQFEKIFKQK